MKRSWQHRKTCVFSMVFFISTWSFAQSSPTGSAKPDTVTFRSGELQLKGLIWKPTVFSPCPVILYNHGSGPTPQRNIAPIAKAFLDQGYAFFIPFRRGQGLSTGQGQSIVQELDSVSQRDGNAARFPLMIKLHETTQLTDQLAAMSFLKTVKGIDTQRIIIAGHSFGGIQSMLIAANPHGAKAIVNFAGAAMVWGKSAEVNDWLKQMAPQVTIPVYFIQAKNDFSIEPSLVLSEEMKKAGKTCVVKIYPPYKQSEMEAHFFIEAVQEWGPDLFRTLKEWVPTK